VRILNLNNYTIVPEGDATLKVVLRAAEGETPLVLFLRGRPQAKNRNYASYADMKSGKVKWNKAIEIEATGSPEEYIELVDWWFGEATKDRSYADSINDTYIALGDVAGAIYELKDWLTGDCAFDVNLKGEWLNRKTHINRFLRNRLNAKKRQTKYHKGR
jgi:hypothetical protein